ncbi:MAG: single-stranded-DNA-specific exonuclease RecJ [Clostridiales bacterium]|nr:single-stranded-DNA-specific exonuclease RecJ [Clostridiales bacterium]
MSKCEEKRWIIAYNKPQLQCSMSRELNISPTIAGLLINRGIHTVEEARRFFNCKIEELSSPWLLGGMQDAVERILQAKKNGEKVTVYGDYDVDGLTGTTLLLEALQKLQIETTYYIPHRLEEGYGLNKDALENIAKEGSKLVVTVDCGITSVAEVKYAQEDLLMDVIITDHHQPADEKPPAVALINPKLEGRSTYYNLAGVGVAFKLVQALWEKAGFSPEQVFEEFLDIVTLGTIADIVPLIEENRILVKNGLERFASTKREGLKALMEVAGLSTSDINPRNIAYGLAPRLNAAGRISDASYGVELLTTSSSQKARELAKFLQNENQKRQVLEKNILAEAQQMVEEEFDFSRDKVIVLASKMWHPGVIGIVASRLVEKYYRPVIIIAIEGDEGKGSARSIPGFNIYEAIKSASKHLLQFGGHELAAGLSLASHNISDFKESINEYARIYLTDDLLVPTLLLDSEIFFHELTEDLLQQIKDMEPFGEGNPSPLLAYRGAKVVGYKPVGKDKNHLKMQLKAEGKALEAIGFELYSKAEVAATKEIDLAFSLEENTWQGETRLQLNIKDIQASNKSNFLQNTVKDCYMEPPFEEDLLQGQNYFLQGSPQKIFYNVMYFIVNALREGKRALIAGSIPSLTGSFFSAHHMLLSEMNMPHWFIKTSCLGEQLKKIADNFTQNSGIVFTDLYALKCAESKFLLENSDLIIFLGAETTDKKLDGIPILDEELLENKTVIINYIQEKNLKTRNYDIFLTQLDDILIENKKTVIYCTTKKEVMEVAKIIWNRYNIKAIYHHPWMTSYQQELALEMFKQGLVKYLVTTSTIGLDRLGFCEQVFFYRLPFDSVHYLYLMAGQEKQNLEIAIAEDANVNTGNMLEAMFPSRKTLSHIYSYIKKRNILDIKGCLNFLRSNGCPKANGETIKTARSIFQELGIEKNTTTKVDLHKSWRYRSINRQHEGYQKLLQILKI